MKYLTICSLIATALNLSALSHNSSGHAPERGVRNAIQLLSRGASIHADAISTAQVANGVAVNRSRRVTNALWI